LRLGKPALVETNGPVIVVLLSLAAGCNDGDGDPFHCGRVEPCGGDLVGNWKVVDGCLNTQVAAAEAMTIVGGSCRNVISGAVTTSYGTLALGADLGFTASLTFSGLASPSFPESCLAGRTCAEMQAFLAAEGVMVQECIALGTASCTCYIAAVSSEFGGSGTYLATDTTLELRPDGVAAWSKQYCVTGAQLHITGTNGAKFLDDLVLERQ
jgi:hypothetical protein